MFRFQCYNYGYKIKPLYEYTIRKGKHPECQQAVMIPHLDEKNPILISRTTNVKSQSGVQNTVHSISQEHQTYETHEKMRQCSFWREQILRSTKKCRYCQKFFHDSSNFLNTTGKSVSGISQLREEYESPPQEQKTCSQLSFIFGVLGLLILTGSSTFINQAPLAGFFIWFASLTALVIRLSSYAKDKGRSPWIALSSLLTIIGLIILMLLEDFRNKRIIEVSTMPRTGSSLNGHDRSKLSEYY